MAITHSLTKTYTGPPWPPGLLLSYLNRHLASHYTGAFGSFVTAFYAIYDPDRGTLTYANAGHVPPRLIRCQDGIRQALEGKKRLPLGISEREEYPEDVLVLVPGDQVIFCTDGITDAENGKGEQLRHRRPGQGIGALSRRRPSHGRRRHSRVAHFHGQCRPDRRPHPSGRQVRGFGLEFLIIWRTERRQPSGEFRIELHPAADAARFARQS